MLKDRLRSAGYILAAAAILLFADSLFTTSLLSGVVILGMVLMCVGEFSVMVESTQARLFLKAIALFAIPYFWVVASFPGATEPLVILGFGLMVVSAISQTLRDDGRAFANLGVTAFAFVYFVVWGGFIYQIRLFGVMETGSQASGIAAIIFFLLVVKSSDIGAYFVGRSFGTVKLIPKLSPGKTVEGFYGGIFVAMGISFLLSWLVGLGFWASLSFGAIMAVCGQAGDLLESLFKRNAGIKDSGALIPGMGGFFDVMDSPIFCAPVAYLLLKHLV